MTTTEIADRLAQHETLKSAPRAELEWVASHGTVRHLQPGDLLSRKGKPVDGMYIMLEGRVSLYIDRGSGLQRSVDWRPGDVSGLLPYSRMTSPPGDAIAQEPTLVLAVHRDQFPDLIHACHEVTGILVHNMLDRARAFTSDNLRDERLMSLGKLSAGLAHELNNPVAAIERGASHLERRLEEVEKAARALAAARLSDAQLAVLDTVQVSCHARPAGVRSPLQEAEREEALEDWLGDHGLDENLAGMLAETAITTDGLDEVAASVDGHALEAVVRWVASGCTVRGLTSEIQEAATRVSGLVLAIKGFTHMDQALAAEPVDLRSGLANTVAVLRSKAKGKVATVTVDVPDGLPRVRGFVGELNQVWSNLIENALDALPEGGRVDVRASQEDGRIVVRVIDNGSGIPSQILDRIFDPFFTTKPVGQGTGLGLDIVRRLVQHNDGEIDVESAPGRTEFRVSLPVDGSES
jgi:signal transduction histidine kinase